MAEFVQNRVYLRTPADDIDIMCDRVVGQLMAAGVDGIGLDRQDCRHAVLTFATPWEPPVEAARRIRRQVGSVLCGWFVVFEDMAAGIGPFLPALCREGFDRFRAAPDANSARLNFESCDGF